MRSQFFRRSLKTILSQTSHKLPYSALISGHAFAMRFGRSNSAVVLLFNRLKIAPVKCWNICCVYLPRRFRTELILHRCAVEEVEVAKSRLNCHFVYKILVRGGRSSNAETFSRFLDSQAPVLADTHTWFSAVFVWHQVGARCSNKSVFLCGIREFLTTIESVKFCFHAKPIIRAD